MLPSDDLTSWKVEKKYIVRAGFEPGIRTDLLKKAMCSKPAYVTGSNRVVANDSRV